MSPEGHRKFKTSLKQLVMSESKEVLKKKKMGLVKGSQEPIRRKECLMAKDGAILANRFYPIGYISMSSYIHTYIQRRDSSSLQPNSK